MAEPNPSEDITVNSQPSKISRRTAIKAGALGLGSFISSFEGGLKLVDALGIRKNNLQRQSLPQASNPDEESTHTEVNRNVVAGVDTYGTEKPLNHTNLPALFDKLNNEKLDIDSDTYYSTIFADQSTYKNFSKKDWDNVQVFLNHQFVSLNDILSESGNIHNIQAPKISLRRLIVVEDRTGLPEMATLKNKLHDSDGGWALTENYHPEGSAYYDKLKRDNGFLHELGHSTLHLPDEYSLDVANWGMQPVWGEMTIAEWQSYKGALRSDIGHDLMNTVEPNIKLHTLMQLARRQDVHAFETVKEGSWDFPNEIPEKVMFQFDDKYAESKMTLYQSYEVDPEKRKSEQGHFFQRTKGLDAIGKFTIEPDGSVKFDSASLGLFEFNGKSMIPAESATWLLSGFTSSGEHIFRWFDIRDLNIAAWKGFEKGARLKMQMASDTDKPEHFNWNIQCSALGSSTSRPAVLAFKK